MQKMMNAVNYSQYVDNKPNAKQMSTVTGTLELNIAEQWKKTE